MNKLSPVFHNSINENPEKFQVDDATLNQAVAKVFIWTFFGLAISAMMSYVTVTFFFELYMSIVSNTFMFLILSFSPMIVFMYANSRLEKMSANALANVFFLFSITLGFFISGVFVIYSNESIILTFGITSVTFFIMALYGYTTKTNLLQFSKLVMFALVGLIVAFIFNMIFPSSMMNMIISFLGVIIYTFLIAYDTQWIKESIQYEYGMTGRLNYKVALLGAMHLLLNFVNLFLFLLRFFGSSDD